MHSLGCIASLLGMWLYGAKSTVAPRMSRLPSSRDFVWLISDGPDNVRCVHVAGVRSQISGRCPFWRLGVKLSVVSAKS